jgi:hypothetical protein
MSERFNEGAMGRVYDMGLLTAIVRLAGVLAAEEDACSRESYYSLASAASAASAASGRKTCSGSLRP